MGSALSRESSNNKLAVSSTSTPKAEPTQRIRNERLAQLVDPRSPSADIDRTPIQVAASTETPKLVPNGCALPSEDPRSPTIGITRTPVRDEMRATVGSFARRLGILFYNEASSVSIAPPGRFSKPSSLNVEEEKTVPLDGELGSMEPLLACQPPQNFGSMAQHAHLLSTPIKTPAVSTGDMSPFVLIDDLQVEVETDVTLEEAEEARESPVHKRLSMSLVTCHEGATSSHIFADVHCDSPAAVENSRVGPDHTYALAPVITYTPATPQSPVQLDMPTATEVPVSSEQLEEAQVPTSVETEELDTVPEPLLTSTAALEPQITPTPEAIVAEDQATPAPAEAQTTPAALESQITHAAPEDQATPAPAEDQAAPAEDQATPAPAEDQATPAPAEGQITPAAPEPEIVPEAQDTPTTTPEPPAAVGPTPSPQAHEVQSSKGLRCPNLNTKSPSQVVFKPQWLGKGFGATGLRARGVQARRSKGGSSPLAVRVAVKNVYNDNKGQSTKSKEKGLAEGRSPLQILKETNSPRQKSSQKKVKVSTPDRQRLGQLDRRTLAVSLDKENR